jgi:hypothetical protein
MEGGRKQKNVLYVRADTIKHVIYDAGGDGDRKKDSPQIIEEINEYFNSVPHDDLNRIGDNNNASSPIRTTVRVPIGITTPNAASSPRIV